jgi:hypothetical protein
MTRLSVEQRKRNVGRCGTVVVYPPTVEGGVGVPVAPDGSLISTSSTTTSGLQEAINYAYTNGCDLHIVGGDEPIPVPLTAGPTSGAVVYQLTDTLQFRPMQGCSISSGAVTLNWGVAHADPCVQFDTMLMTDIRLKGTQLVNAGTGVTLLFKPENSAPSDTLFGIGMQATFDCFSVVNIHGTASNIASVPLIEFDATNGPITYSKFYINEPNAGGIALRVKDPGASSAFHDNLVHCQFIHGQVGGTNNVVQIGTSTVANTRITNNVWDLFMNTANTGKGVSTYERNGLYRNLGVVSGSQSYGVFFEDGAAGNTVLYNQLSGTNSFTNFVSAGGALDKNRLVGMAAAGTVQFSITPSGSPYSYQNLTGSDLMVIVSGGTVSDVAIGSLSVNTISLGVTSGCFMLKPGAYIKVTYSSAPTMAGIL